MILVAGAGGMIGGWLVKRLIEDGERVVAVDLKDCDDWFQVHPDASSIGRQDLRDELACSMVVKGAREVYNLAADMGGMGFIESHKADCMLSVLINTNLLLAARRSDVHRYFFASSACVYPDYMQGGMNTEGPEDGWWWSLREEDVYPAMPEDGYGWEKLFSERMCRHFTEDFELRTRVARLHNVYGTLGSWDGGREKAPAAICRKVAEALRDDTGVIEIWGDGEQTRSFMHIDDCVEGMLRIMRGDYPDPVNLGSEELVSIKELVTVVETAATGDATLTRHFDLGAPQGVRGRCSNNDLLRERYGWEPTVSLAAGIAELYPWVAEQVAARAVTR